MKKEIEGYPDYYIIGEEVYRHRNDSKVTVQRNNKCKVKDSSGTWRTISLNTLLALSGSSIELPIGAKQIPGHENYYIDTSGNVYSFTALNPRGIKLSTWVGRHGYLVVSIDNVKYDLHYLMLHTFKLENYTDKGLVCMHLDDDKTNPKLSNLELGTYSQNNKDAYDRGLNPGNGFSK